MNDLEQLARAAYWLATLHRRGESLPDGIGHDAAREAHEIVQRLGIRPDRCPAVFPIEGRFKAIIRFETTAAAQSFARNCGLKVRTLEPDMIEVTR